MHSQKVITFENESYATQAVNDKNYSTKHSHYWYFILPEHLLILSLCPIVNCKSGYRFAAQNFCRSRQTKYSCLFIFMEAQCPRKVHSFLQGGSIGCWGWPPGRRYEADIAAAAILGETSDVERIACKFLRGCSSTPADNHTPQVEVTNISSVDWCYWELRPCTLVTTRANTFHRPSSS